MKKSKRNLVILTVVLVMIFYGTFLVVRFTSVPVRHNSAGDKDTPKEYLRSLQLRLYELVVQKQFAEAEIVFKRVRKLAPGNRSIQKLGSVVCFRNGKLNEAENLLRNLLLRNPEDFICRNNYAAVLMAKGRTEAVREMERAWVDSGGKAFIGENLRQCARRFKVKLSFEIPVSTEKPLNIPADAISVLEENK